MYYDNDNAPDPGEVYTYRQMQRRYNDMQRRAYLDQRDPDALDDEDYEHLEAMKSYMDSMF